MPILKDENARKSEADRDALRIYPVTTKLTKMERNAVTELAYKHGVARGQWIRDVILAQIKEDSNRNYVLAEALGIRLLLVNVLRPLATGQRVSTETFDKLLDEISTAKHELAAKIASEPRR
jgi:hypothetical protein